MRVLLRILCVALLSFLAACASAEGLNELLTGSAIEAAYPEFTRSQNTNVQLARNSSEQETLKQSLKIAETGQKQAAERAAAGAGLVKSELEYLRETHQRNAAKAIENSSAQ
jgi:hypothetical protein